MIKTSRVLAAQQLLQRLARRSRQGFTLIELLVVVVIIGILASIALPSFVGAQDKARNASVQANVNTVRLALEQYSTDNNGSYPVATSLASATGGVLKNNYLPGNKLPRSPWSTGTQTVSLNATGVPFTSALNVGLGTPMPSLGTAITTGGGSIQAAAPSVQDHYGALMYDNDANSQTYVVYGTGKRNKDSIIGAETTNNGN